MNRFLLLLFCTALFFSTPTIPLAAAEEPQPAIGGGAAPLSLLPALPVTTPPAAIEPVTRLGLVDINRISAESDLGKAAQAQIKAQQTKLQKQVDSKQRQLEKAKLELERQMPALTPAQRTDKAKQFQKRVDEFQKFGMNAERGLQQTQERLTKNLLTAIEQAGSTIGKQKGLAAVVVTRELLYLASGVEVIDISEDVIRQANETTPKN